MQAAKLTVHGRVQGVGFRYWTRRVANDLGLAGWVRNRTDRSVEVWAQGPEKPLEEFLGFLRKGPRGAVVDSVAVEHVQPDASLDGFRISF